MYNCISASEKLDDNVFYRKWNKIDICVPEMQFLILFHGPFLRILKLHLFTQITRKGEYTRKWLGYVRQRSH